MSKGRSEPDIEVVIRQDAAARLAGFAVARGWSAALLVTDTNTARAAGAALAAAFRGAGVVLAEISLGEHPEPTDAVVARVRAALRPGTEPVAVGSGVITDVVRYAAHLEGRDFTSVPTAASMDGYASGVAAMQVDGVKVTYLARPPVAIFADPRVCAAAPIELTRSGIGDLLGKATAQVDWLASHLLYGEPFVESVAARVAAPLSYVAADPRRLLAAEPGAIAGLLDGLVQSGIAMAIVGSSRPASGCEHHFSHFWDLLAARGMRPRGSHGLQVGFATHFAMRLQRFAFGGGLRTLRQPRPARDPLDADARRWLGEPSAEIAAAVAEKQRFTISSPVASTMDWDAIQAALAPSLARFGQVERALLAAGIPPEPGYLSIDENMLRAAFRHATRLRARYTVIDFLEGQGALEEAIDAVLRN